MDRWTASVLDQRLAAGGKPDMKSSVDAFNHDGCDERPDQCDDPAIAVLSLCRRPHRALDGEAHEQGRQQNQPRESRQDVHHSAADRCR